MKVFFFCHPPGDTERAGYEHPLVALAEGLRELGVDFAGNVDCWREDPDTVDHLIRVDRSPDWSDYDAVIFSDLLFSAPPAVQLPDALLSPDRKPKLVAIEWQTGGRTSERERALQAADLRLKVHYSASDPNPANAHPWQIGLTHRMIKAARPKPWTDREDFTLSNFRRKHPLRDLVEDRVMAEIYRVFPLNGRSDACDPRKLSPRDRLYWQQTGKLHFPSLYERLGSAKLANAVEGKASKQHFFNRPAFTRNPFGSALATWENKSSLLRYNKVERFDSYRFWQSLISGCCTLHLDFEHFGMRLPEMPRPDEHYLALHLDKPPSLTPKLKDEGLLRRLAEAGRAWALEHYHPTPVARRLLGLLETNPAR